MEDVHHFDIDVKLTGQGSTVLMDGQPLRCVRSVCVKVGIDQLSTVTLEVIGTGKITGDAQVWIKPPDEEKDEDVHPVGAAALPAPDQTAETEARE